MFLGLLPNAFSQDLATMGQQKPFALSGSLDVRGIAYSADGIPARRSPFMYMISGSPTISIYGISIPLSFVYSEQERNFRQPFNQFGMSPAYKWITVHAGYRNVSFSPYTLAGYTMLGGGFELNPGKLRIGFMYGRLNRATTVDTTTGTIQPYSFSRFGYAGKVGYGTEDTHFDLSFLKAKDDEASLKVGNLDQSTVRPAENLVIGADTKVTFAKKLFIFADGAISVYTRDFQSKLALSSEVTGTDIFNKVNKFITINGTSEYYIAYSGGIGYKEKDFSLKVAYKHVDPNFQSMGAYFFQSDIENITISPSFNALKGKLRFLGSLGIQNDNTQKQKQATTKRVIGMANLSWDLTTAFGLDANYTNFSSNSEPTVTKVQNKYLLAQTNQNISVSPRLIIPAEKHTQVFLLSYNYSNLSDVNAETQAANNINTTVAMLNYNLTFNKSGLSLMAGGNYTTNVLTTGTITNKGATLGASKGFLKNQLQFSTSNSYIISTLPQGSSTILNLGVNTSYQPLRNHRLSLRVNYLNNKPSDDAKGGQPKFSETTGELGYTLSF
ncbi:hypothetical protein SAMN04515674_10156 [Pseudarcicella hirudinis]|uniref:Uncharacterized protein n=2 Tax=Pseudarcicella hirudinis TaxID=1079859 RepID=A0A1I5M0G1_9BACT|nr:hypothetical protein SAMN04515674_10156 [Pseudarcicella hirudinis]